MRMRTGKDLGGYIQEGLKTSDGQVLLVALASVELVKQDLLGLSTRPTLNHVHSLLYTENGLAAAYSEQTNAVRAYGEKWMSSGCTHAAMS